MTTTRWRCWVTVACVLCLGWGGASLSAAQEVPGNPQWILSGTMRYINVEGGCWILETDNRGRYQLTGDASILKRLQVDGLQVTVLVEKAPGSVGKCMIGQWVRLVRLLRIEKAPSESSGSETIEKKGESCHGREKRLFHATGSWRRGAVSADGIPDSAPVPDFYLRL
ncbi:hypothetical protein [Salinithrix halophila]|uniref:Uncharacterized protein n=1 Tax=Salinithrix halophila TaxID=1485204 RepID=A0ABV8JIB2_9BACL